MANKELKFEFVLAPQGLKEVQNALDDLTRRAREFAKAMNSAGGGMFGGGNAGAGTPNAVSTPGAAAGQGGPKINLLGGTNSLKATAEAFKQMQQDASRAMAALAGSVKTSASSQQQQIQALIGTIGQLKQAYGGIGGVPGGFGGGLPGGSRPGLPPSPMLQYMGGAAAGGGGVGAQAAMGAPGGVAPPPTAPGAIPPPPPGGGAGGLGGGGGFGVPFTLGGAGQGLLQWALGNSTGAMASRMVGVVGAGAYAGLKQEQTWNNATLDLRAERAKQLMPSLNRLMKNDITDILKTQELATYDSQERREVLGRSLGLNARVLAGIGAAASTAKGLVTGGSGITAMTDAALDTETMKRMNEARDLMGNTVEYNMGVGRANDYRLQTADSRLAASRMLGLGINYKRDAKGAILKGPDGKSLINDSFSGWMSGLQQGGWSPEEAMSAWSGARQTRGLGFANAFGGTIMSAQAAGFGQVGAVLGAAASNGAVGLGGKQALAAARGLVGGALGGGIDQTAGLQMASNLFGYDPRGMVSGSGALAAIQGGFQFTGGVEDFNTVSRIQTGMKSADALASGFDGYQKGMNLVSAITAMPGGSTYAQDALAGRMSFKELAQVARDGSKASARATAYGITSDMAKSQLGGMAHGLFSRFVDQNGSDPASVAMRKMLHSGMDTNSYLGKLGDRARGGDAAAKSELESIGVISSDLMGGDTEGGIGMVQALSGVKNLGAKLKTGNIPGAGRPDDLNRAAYEEEAKRTLESAKQLRENFDRIVKALSQVGETMQATVDFAPLSAAADEAAAHLYRLAGTPMPEIDRARGRGDSTTRKGTPVQPTRGTGQMPGKRH